MGKYALALGEQSKGLTGEVVFSVSILISKQIAWY